MIVPATTLSPSKTRAARTPRHTALTERCLACRSQRRVDVRDVIAQRNETSGLTRIFDCCLFEWSQVGSRRYVRLEPQHHEACIRELDACAAAQGIVVVLVTVGGAPCRSS